MEIGNQIKALRLRKGATQKQMAQHFGITEQAISKWENGASVPDIGMLPGLSAYFGVSIDELFALSDKTRMERIQNMLWDVRFMDSSDVENERNFLLEKARRESGSSEAYEMLAKLELHLAEGHNARAEEYALAALKIDPNSSYAHTSLMYAMGGKHIDPRHNIHNALISYYKSCAAAHPEAVAVYPHLIAQLMDDNRMEEAEQYLALMEQHDTGYFSPYYLTILRIRIALARRDMETARALWQKLERENPDNWSLQHDIGDFHMLAGEYAAAKESYRKAIGLMKAPRYTDPIDSLAKVCEMDGDIHGAIEARRLELEVLKKEWDDTTGEGVDRINREIARLEKLKET